MNYMTLGFSTICCPLTLTILGAVAGILLVMAITWFLFTVFAVFIVQTNRWLDAVEEIDDLPINK